MKFNQIHYSMGFSLVIALFFVLLSVGFMTAIGQVSSQNPPGDADKGVWVLTNIQLEDSGGNPWVGSYPYTEPWDPPHYYACYTYEMYLTETPTTASMTGTSKDCPPNKGVRNTDAAIITWSKPPLTLTPGEKMGTNIQSAVVAGHPMYGACTVVFLTKSGEKVWGPVVEDNYVSLVPGHHTSATAKFDVPWGKIGDVGELRIGNYYSFGVSLNVAYVYNYQAQSFETSTYPQPSKEYLDYLKSSGSSTLQETRVPPATEAPGCSWSGTWDIAYGGPLVLQQSGNTVTGTYPFYDGTLRGTVSGNKVIATWTEIRGGNPVSGDYEWEMSDDCTFTGRWRYTTEGFSHDWRTDWPGVARKQSN